MVMVGGGRSTPQHPIHSPVRVSFCSEEAEKPDAGFPRLPFSRGSGSDLGEWIRWPYTRRGKQKRGGEAVTVLSTVAEAWAFQQCSTLAGQAMGRILLHSIALAGTASL